MSTKVRSAVASPREHFLLVFGRVKRWQTNRIRAIWAVENHPDMGLYAKALGLTLSFRSLLRAKLQGSVQHNFVDHVKIYFQSGKGGDGCLSWRREKHVPRGGPNGGDGGHGGSVILRGNAQLWTLLDLKYRKHIKAKAGEQGMGDRKRGKNGPDEVLEVPLGTVVRNAETDEWLGEIVTDGQELVLVPGGQGGLGNWHFRSSTNQAPDKTTPGEPGSELTAILELKLLADVGLVGFPNAGKSTLLATVTAAKPAIADYPFTTLVPNLGIVKVSDYQSFVMADIPGIIEGAHAGKGLGTRFLRHIERNPVLVFVIPAEAQDVAAHYRILTFELEAYDPELMHRDRLLVLSKLDLLSEEELQALRQTYPKDHPVWEISAVQQKGTDALVYALWDKLKREDAADEAAGLTG